MSTGSHVTKEQYDSVCEEKEKLNQDHSRVQAQLEGQVRSLRKKLSKYEGETDTEEVSGGHVTVTVVTIGWAGLIGR